MSVSANNRRREPGRNGTDRVVLAVALVTVVLIGAVWVSVSVGSHLDQVNQPLTRDPITLIAGLIRHTIIWPKAATLIALAIAIGLLVIVGFFVGLRRAGRKNRTNVDHAARYMASLRDLAHMREKEGKKRSKRLGVTDSAGVPVGKLFLGGVTLFASFEDMMILIAGPRVGKSTSLVIPAITAAPGAVVTTSNKRDVLDATRDVRAVRGPVWVFDPQSVALEPASWWWDPLSYVTDDTKAAKLAQHFASGTTAVGAKTDAYFDGKGQNLLAALLLAAAVRKRPITDVYEWLTNVTRTEAIDYLEAAGYRRLADGVNAVQRSSDKQRDGIYSSAERMASCLNNSGIERWVNPDPAPLVPRPQFNPHDFVQGSGTLYSLSREGAGTAGPLVTALTAATIEAAEELAARSRGGRLQTPLLGILDEAANVCRWTDLPDLYSHYGSRGIPIMSVFQSYSQGVAIFGREGMRKLWSASNVKVYAGGVSEPDFLAEMSDLIGTFDRATTSESYTRGVRSTSTALKREKILEVQELADMPRGRAVLFSSGSRAALLRTVPWFEGPNRQQIEASIAAHEPREGNGRP